MVQNKVLKEIWSAANINIKGWNPVGMEVHKNSSWESTGLWNDTIITTGVNPGGGGGGWGDISPHFFGWGGGWPVLISPPLFEDKITLNLTFIVKKLTFSTVKLLKTNSVNK